MCARRAFVVGHWLARAESSFFRVGASGFFRSFDQRFYVADIILLVG